MIIDFFLVALCIVTLLLLLAIPQQLFLQAPFVSTEWKVAEAMVKLAQPKAGQKAADLGAGDARILVLLKQSFPQVHAEGWELLLSAWILGKLRIARSKQAIPFHLGSFLKADLREADIVFLYLWPDILADLLQKFKRELRPGTILISHAFELQGLKPERVEAVGKKRVYRYRWQG